MLVVYSPGGCIKNRLAKVFKNAAMQDDRHNLELYKSKKGCKDHKSIQSSTTPDTGYQRESDKLTIRHHKRKAHINRPAQRHSKHKTEQKHKKIHKRSTALERSVKYFTGGLKLVSQRQPHH